MSSAVWTPQAAAEFDDILYYISFKDRRPLTGEKLYYEIRRLAEDYARPDAARHSHPLSPTGWYYFLHKRWLIFYQLLGDGIEVMRVIDGTRDLPPLLR